MVFTIIRCVQDVTRERLLPRKDCDWESVELIDFVRRDEFVDSRRFGALLVESQAMRITVDGKSRISTYRACNIRMS